MNWFPKFMIIGGVRCGTTSLFNILQQDDRLTPSIVKETNFFNGPSRNKEKYRKCFPHGSLNTYEGSPNYLYGEKIPQRIKEFCELFGVDIKKLKFVALLREPASRARSHWSLRVRNETEERSLRTATEASIEVFLKTPFSYHGAAGKEADLIQRGIYVEQLKRWCTVFSPEQVYVVSYHDFYGPNFNEEMRRLSDFLGLRAEQVFTPEHSNKSPSNFKLEDADTSATMANLMGFYYVYNHQLDEYLVSLGKKPMQFNSFFI